MFRNFPKFILMMTLTPFVLIAEGRGEPLRPAMTRLSESLKTLIPLSGSPLSWENPKNHPAIEKNLKLLLESSHLIKGNGGAKPEVRDPVLGLLQPYLTEEASITLSAFRLGRLDYARKNLRNVLSSCIACHSREPELGAVLAPGGNGELKKLDALERARWFSAIRDFDHSIEEYHRSLFEPGLAKRDLYAWERSFREVMTLLIRVKRTPEAALTLVRKLLGMNNIPYFLKRELLDWEKSLASWPPETLGKNTGEAAELLEIHRIQERADKKKSYPLDHSADALYLRLSSLLYEFIRKHPESPDLAEAWYLLGRAHQTLDMPPLENLHEKFLEACIRARPHSPLAQNCYTQLEQSLFYGFTGSSGTRLPDKVMKRLIELWGLAFVPSVIQK